MVWLVAITAGGCGSSKKNATKPPSSSTATTSRPVKKLPPEMSVDDKLGHKIVQEARKWLGTPYVYGGQTRGKGTDCSGMTMTVIEKVADVRIPRNSAKQQEYCMTIDRRLLEPGDLVFFASKRGGSRVSHVGIYIGENKVIHASASRGVIISSLSETYYNSHFHSAGRIKGLTCAATGRKVKKQKQDKADVTPQIPTAVTKATAATPAPPEAIGEISLDELISHGIPGLSDTLPPPPVRIEEPAIIQIPAVNPDTLQIDIPDIPTPHKEVPVFRQDSTAVSPDSIRSEVRRAMQMF